MGIESGYGYVYDASTPLESPFARKRAKRLWRKSPSEAWATEVLSAEPDALYLGERHIDGSNCTVWQTADGTIVAQVSVHTPAPLCAQCESEGAGDDAWRAVGSAVHAAGCAPVPLCDAHFEGMPADWTRA